MVVILGVLDAIVSKNIMKKLLFISVLCSMFFYSHRSTAERVGGPGIIEFSLEPDEEKIFRVNLKVDKPHIFIGAGHGGHVDYFVYNANGTLIASDTADGSDCNIEFVPKLPGYHLFLAKNWSDDPSEIVVRTN